jgi:hypothetical protein
MTKPPPSPEALLAEGRELGMDLFHEHSRVGSDIWHIAVAHSVAWDIRIFWDLEDEPKPDLNKYIYKYVQRLISIISAVAHEDLTQEFLDFYTDKNP